MKTFNWINNLPQPQKMHHRILLWLLMVASIPLMVSNFLGLQESISMVKAQSLQRMELLAKEKTYRIEKVLDEAIENLKMLSENQIIIDTLGHLNRHYKLEEPLKIRHNDPVVAYTNQYLSNMKNHHSEFYDIFIVTVKGDIALTVRHEYERNINLLDTRHHSGGISQVFRTSKILDNVAISDFKRYPPSKVPSLFLANAVYYEKKYSGTIIIQLNPNFLQAITSDYAGLGKTGEVILAKKKEKNALLLIPIRYNPKSAFNQQVTFQKDNIKPIIHALNGNQGSGIFKDYRDVDVIAAWHYIPSLRWGIVVKIDVSEALAPIEYLKNKYAIIVLITSIMIIFSAILLARSLSQPIKRLDYSIRKILKYGWEKGDEVELLNNNTNEINALSQSFNLLMKKNSESELQRNNADIEKEKINRTLETIVTHATDGIFIINEKHIITFFNPEAEQLFGYKAEEVLGKDMNILLPKPSYKKHKVYVHSFRDSVSNSIKKIDSRHNIPIMGRHKNGHIFPADVGISKTYSDDGQWTFTAFIRDTTDHHAIEEALKEAKDNAEKANQAKSTFLANMSNELRTPMHAILSYAQMGFRRVDKVSIDKLKYYYENIDVSAQRLLILLNDLLDLSKLESEKMELNMAEQNIIDIVNACHSELSAKLSEHHLSLVGAFLDNGETSKLMMDKQIIVSCDAQRIHQLIINLLSNAIKFSPEGSQITVVYSIVKNKYIKLQFIDQGVGILPHQLETIFDKFIQNDSQGNGTGMGSTGLGLAICKEIISLHKGEIWAEHSDAENKGGIVCFTLPI